MGLAQKLQATPPAKVVRAHSGSSLLRVPRPRRSQSYDLCKSIEGRTAIGTAQPPHNHRDGGAACRCLLSINSERLLLPSGRGASTAGTMAHRAEIQESAAVCKSQAVSAVHCSLC